MDLRFALRLLRRNPGFAAVAVLVMALGIGANTAIFSVVSGVLMRPLPFAHPDRLVQLNEIWPRNGIGPVTLRDINEWRIHSASFEAIAAYSNQSRNVQEIAEPERVQAVMADRGLFRMLGVEAVMGRTFREDDPPDVVVIGAGFAQRHFSQGSPIGRRITLDGAAFTVIGVMPDAFQFPYRAGRTELWYPWEIPAQFRHLPNLRADLVVGRVKPGVSLDRARAELAAMTHDGRVPVITPLSEVIVGKARNQLMMLLGAAGLVLLAACANVANLLLARTAARAKEIGIRAALGAGRARIVRQLLTESILLALVGGLVGLAIAVWAARLLVHLAAAQIPRAWEIGLDWRVFTFLLAVSVATGIGFGLAPALAATRGKPHGRTRSRFRDALVVVEIALAFILLAGAGLLLRAFLHLQNTPTGLVAENVLTLNMSIARELINTRGAAAPYCAAIEERVARIPGVRAAGFISYLPLQNFGWWAHFSLADGGEGTAELRYVSPAYFRTLGIPLRKGRGFTDRDNADAPAVVLINEALARRYFPNQDPVGRRITARGTIVGVVGDVRQSSLGLPPAPEIYYPLAQNAAQGPAAGMTLVMSARMPPETLVSAVRGAIREVNRNQAIFNVKTMQRVLADSLSDLNLYLWLLGLFAGLALLLAAAGIYGVISYLVSSRTREFGIRMALGADGRRLLKLVLGHSALLVALGLALGIAGAVCLTRLLKALLFGVAPTDPATLAAMAVLLGAVALAASLVPARRAMKVDPSVALRSE
jgi:putative ABC transport system permease protein